MEKRIEWIDIAKSLGIFLVVIGHTGINVFMPSVSKWIYSFHMPLFYFISGMMFNGDKYSSDFCLFFKKRFKSLIFPYILFNTIIFILCRNLGSLPSLHVDIGQLISGCGPLYFIRVLFVIEVWYLFIYKVFQKRKVFILFFIAIILLLCYYVRGINSAELALSSEKINWGMLLPALPLFYYGLGNLMRTTFFSLSNKGMRIIVLATFMSSILLLPVRLCGYEIILPALIGIVFIFSLSILLQNKMDKKIRDGITYIGRNTLIIVAFHGFIYNILKVPLSVYHFPMFIEAGIRFSLLWILLIFLISVINKYFPWMIGKYNVLI